jgi:hypothetical protein
MRVGRTILMPAALAACTLLALANCSVRANSGYAFYFENDVFYPPKNDDQNYTMGLAFKLFGTENWMTNHFLARVHGAANACTADLIIGKDEGEQTVGLTFAGTVFTPENLRDPEPIRDDRPYASVIYYASESQRVNKPRTAAVYSQLQIGALGLDVAKSVQKWIHREITDSPNPRGWPHQISDGGEPTALYRLGCKHTLVPSNDVFQAYARLEGDVGYYNLARAGVGFRFGMLNSPWYSFDSQPLKAEAMDDRRESVFKEAFVFGAVQGVGVAYNALLQGQFRDSEVVVDDCDLERLMWEFQTGAGLTVGKFNFVYSLAGRSREFKGPEARDHYWGGLFFTYAESF